MSDSIEAHGDFHFVDSTQNYPVGLRSKRVIDIAFALSGLVLLAPLFLLCYIAIKLSSPGPVFFGHKRVGFNGKTFGCLKFRTMVPNAEQRLREFLESDPAASAEWASCRKLRFDPRITAIGAILRKTSLDELPQLFNVLAGDMSIVGPRPVPADELALYRENARDYLTCRPGITGLWQVSGRSSTTYSRRIAYDTFYSRNWSLALDTKIIVLTLPSLLNSDNVY